MAERKIVWHNGDAISNNRDALGVPENTSASLMQQEVEARVERMSKNERQQIVGKIDQFAISQGLVVGDTPIPLIHVPILQDGVTIDRHAQDISRVHRAMLKVEGLAFSDNPLGEEILRDVSQGMYPEGGTLMNLARKVRLGTASRRNTRFDTFYTTSGQMWMIEANTIAPEGIYYHGVLTQCGAILLNETGMLQPDIVNQLRNTAPYYVYNSLEQEHLSRAGSPPENIGIIYEGEGEENLINSTELPRMVYVLSAIASQKGQQIQVITGTPSELEAGNGVIYLKGNKVDIIWRNNLEPEQYRGISQNGGNKKADGLLEVVGNPDIYPILNDERARFEGYKEVMAYLHYPDIQKEAKITPDEVEAINRVVPFTFDPSETTRIGLNGKGITAKELLTAYAEHFVLKPKVGTHGHGVSFGVNAGDNPKEWEVAVDEAIEGGKMVAQQYIPYQHISYPTLVIEPDGSIHREEYYMDTNMHVIGGGATGTNICRASPVSRFEGKLGVLNVAAGGGLRPSFKV